MFEWCSHETSTPCTSSITATCKTSSLFARPRNLSKLLLLRLFSLRRHRAAEAVWMIRGESSGFSPPLRSCRPGGGVGGVVAGVLRGLPSVFNDALGSNIHPSSPLHGWRRSLDKCLLSNLLRLSCCDLRTSVAASATSMLTIVKRSRDRSRPFLPSAALGSGSSVSLLP